MSQFLIVVQVLENKIVEKDQELQAEVIQRDQISQDKLEVLHLFVF